MSKRRDHGDSDEAQRGPKRAPSLYPTETGAAPFRNMLTVPEVDPRFGGEMRREVRSSALKRLGSLDAMYRELLAEARSVIGGARRDLELHEVKVNANKLRGRDYHLYMLERDGQAPERFFAILEPDEYARIRPEVRWLGSYRLNHDGSWTRLDEDDEADKQGWAEEGGGA